MDSEEKEEGTQSVTSQRGILARSMSIVALTFYLSLNPQRLVKEVSRYNVQLNYKKYWRRVSGTKIIGRSLIIKFIKYLLLNVVTRLLPLPLTTAV